MNKKKNETKWENNASGRDIYMYLHRTLILIRILSWILQEAKTQTGFHYGFNGRDSSKWDSPLDSTQIRKLLSHNRAVPYLPEAVKNAYKCTGTKTIPE